MKRLASAPVQERKPYSLYEAKVSRVENEQTSIPASRYHSTA